MEHFLSLLWIVCLVKSVITLAGLEAFPAAEGPVFTHEPPFRVDFANSTGVRIDCSARGFPSPVIRWSRADGSPLVSAPHVSHALPNGTLVFVPFRAEDYRADVHSVAYVCHATNPSGSIASRYVHVRAVVLQMYEVQVYDEYVIKGNTAVMRCHVPSFVKDYVVVTSWLKEAEYGTTSTIENGGRYMILPSGELHILRAEDEDGSRAYRCRTVHRLTGEVRISANSPSGKLYVTEPRGSVTPRITSSKSSVHVVQGDTVFVPCAAQGFPIPSYSWFAKVSELETIPISTSDRIHQISGTLVLSNAQILDAGTYVCEVSNSMGTVRVETSLAVTGPLSAYIYPQRQIVDLDQSATLTCVVSGYPVTQITWLKDGQPLLTDTINHVTQEVLRLDSISRTDRGMYQCFVSNIHEVAQGTAELRLGDAPPEFHRVFEEQVLHPGSALFLECVSSGNPTPEVTWTRDSLKLPETGRIGYTHFVDVNGDVVTAVNMSRVRVEDGGEYVCEATNHVGRIEHRAHIKVTGPPFVRLKSQITVVAGTELKVRCHVAGHPIEEISWKRDDRVLPVNHRQKVFPDGTLVVQNVQNSLDSGRYTCVARGQGVIDRKDVEVIVMAPPKITPFSFQDDHLREGMRARIQCMLSDGDLPIAITWLKDGRPLSPDVDSGVMVRDLDDFSSMLTVGSVSSRHNGNYTCVATNNAARVNYTTPLSVNVPPKIMPFSFLDAQLQEGMRVQVTCSVSQGDSPMEITWAKDGLPLPASLGWVVRKFDEFASSLSVEKVSSIHSGNYTCAASNRAAQVQHSSLLLINVPPRWVKQPQDGDVFLGGNVQIVCGAEGFPTPLITWFRASGDTPGDYRELVMGSSHLKQLEDGSLQVTGARENDRGLYLCKANNGIGAGLSEVVRLSVHVPAYFHTKRRNVTCKIGEDALLTCEASGDKPLSVTWSVTKQPSRADNVHRYKVTETPWERGMTSQLLIERVERHHTGVYPCVAKNTFGHDEAAVHLLVQEPPEAVASIRTTETNSRRIQLSWIPPYNGNAPITLYIIQYKEATKKWQEESRNVTLFGQAATHVLERLQPATRYHVRIYAKNEVGSSQPSQHIEVQTAMEAPGGPPQFLRVETVDSTTLTAYWKPPRKELWNGRITGYKIGYKTHDAERKEYVYRALTLQENEDMPKEQRFPLINLKKFTKYSIIVHAFNHLGTGPASEEVVARTGEDVPSKAPGNIRCSPVSSQGLLVTWDPPPPPYINGQLLGYRVHYRPVSDWIDDSTMEAKISQTWKTSIHGLEKFRNYSITVLGFTRAGDGASSNPIYCQTKEDVPDAPADIKALVMAVDAIVVAWRPPVKANGVVVRYSIYTRSFDTGKEETNKHVVASNNTFVYEAKNLRKNRRYEFWVTASTTVGEGQSTKPVSQTPSPIVPARILAFDANVVTRWKENITLGCRSVGIPTPDAEWRFKEIRVQPNNKFFLYTNGDLQISYVSSADAGLYACRVHNAHGSDAVAYTLAVQAPPEAPAIVVKSVSYTAIEVQWTVSSNGGKAVESYTLYFKRDFGDWEATQLLSRQEIHILEKLWCGTRYHIYMTASNHIGTSDASEVKGVRTKGTAPEMPAKEKLVVENATSVSLNLEAWENGGCTILYFVIEYKAREQTEWTLVANNAKQGKYTILDLHPGSKFNLRMTAHNSAGSTVAEYEFSTLTHFGASENPGSSNMHEDDDHSFLLDINITFPLAALMLFLVVAALSIYCWRRRKDQFGMQQADTSTVQPKQYEARYIATGEKKPTLLQNDFDKGSFTCLLVNVEGSPDMLPCNVPRHLKRLPREEIQPYATYQLPGCKTDSFTVDDWKRYEVYNPGHQTLRKVGSGNVYPQLRKEGECAHVPESSLSDDQEYASPVRSSDTSDSTSGTTNQNPEVDSVIQLPRPPPKPRKPGRKAKVPDLIYRRRGDCSKRPSGDMVEVYPDGGECSSLLRIPRPQLERPSAPIAEPTLIETTFSQEMNRPPDVAGHIGERQRLGSNSSRDGST